MSTALAVPEQHQAQITPMQLLEMAVGRGADIGTIERLSKLQREMREEAAERSFNVSMHKAQSEMRRIGTDATNPQTRSKYATYAKLDSALRPVYTANGFSLSFSSEDSGEKDTLRVICYVSHVEGHTRRYQIDMPADGKGAKGNDVMTRTHAVGAASSYGSRYLLKMIFNVAVGETDDDGNGTSGQRMAEPTLLSYLDSIASAANVDELRVRYMEAYKVAQELGDRDAMAAFERKKDARKKELA